MPASNGRVTGYMFGYGDARLTKEGGLFDFMSAGQGATRPQAQVTQREDFGKGQPVAGGATRPGAKVTQHEDPESVAAPVQFGAAAKQAPTQFGKGQPMAGGAQRPAARGFQVAEEAAAPVQYGAAWGAKSAPTSPAQAMAQGVGQVAAEKTAPLRAGLGQARDLAMGGNQQFGAAPMTAPVQHGKGQPMAGGATRPAATFAEGPVQYGAAWGAKSAPTSPAQAMAQSLGTMRQEGNEAYQSPREVASRQKASPFRGALPAMMGR